MYSAVIAALQITPSKVLHTLTSVRALCSPDLHVAQLFHSSECRNLTVLSLTVTTPALDTICRDVDVDANNANYLILKFAGGNVIGGSIGMIDWQYVASWIFQTVASAVLAACVALWLSSKRVAVSAFQATADAAAPKPQVCPIHP